MEYFRHIPGWLAQSEPPPHIAKFKAWLEKLQRDLVKSGQTPLTELQPPIKKRYRRLLSNEEKRLLSQEQEEFNHNSQQVKNAGKQHLTAVAPGIFGHAQNTMTLDPFSQSTAKTSSNQTVQRQQQASAPNSGEKRESLKTRTAQFATQKPNLHTDGSFIKQEPKSPPRMLQISSLQEKLKRERHDSETTTDSESGSASGSSPGGSADASAEDPGTSECVTESSSEATTEASSSDSGSESDSTNAHDHESVHSGQVPVTAKHDVAPATSKQASTRSSSSAESELNNTENQDQKPVHHSRVPVIVKNTGTSATSRQSSTRSSSSVESERNNTENQDQKPVHHSQVPDIVKNLETSATSKQSSTRSSGSDGLKATDNSIEALLRLNNDVSRQLRSRLTDFRILEVKSEVGMKRLAEKEEKIKALEAANTALQAQLHEAEASLKVLQSVQEERTNTVTKLVGELAASKNQVAELKKELHDAKERDVSRTNTLKRKLHEFFDDL